MILAIYTSRILLMTLGVDDYGLYNLVGSIVLIFSSIKSVLASSVQRFLNYHKGKGDEGAVNDVFVTSLLVNFVISIIFAISIELIGNWFIISKLNIPAESLNVGLFIFHCSVIAIVVILITLPYESVIIANERMNFYAWITIADAALRLLIIFILPYLPYEYLKSYAILIALVTIIIRLVTIRYCNRFNECRIRRKYNRNIVKQLSIFSGWNFLGCTASSFIEEGTNFILNIFGGVVANAARAIANQVKSAITLLANNIVLASQPYIMQSAAKNDRQYFFSLIYVQSRIIFQIIALTVAPLYLFSEQILQLWLKDIPDYTNEFMRAILIYMLTLSFQKSIDIAFKSFGNIAKYQIVDTVIYALSLPIGYIILKNGAPLYYIFYVLAVTRLIDYVFVLKLANVQIHLNIKLYTAKVILPSIKVLGILILLAIPFVMLLSAKPTLWIIYFGVYLITSALCIYFIVSDNTEKNFIKVNLKKLF